MQRFSSTTSMGYVSITALNAGKHVAGVFLDFRKASY